MRSTNQSRGRPVGARVREHGTAYAECEWNARASGELANDRHGAYSRSPPRMYALSNQFTWKISIPQARVTTGRAFLASRLPRARKKRSAPGGAGRQPAPEVHRGRHASQAHPPALIKCCTLPTYLSTPRQPTYLYIIHTQHLTSPHSNHPRR